MKKERWKIVKYKNVRENMYAISSYGNIMNTKTNTKINPWKGKNGYMYIALMCDNNKPMKIGMHVLVAKHFIKKPNKKEKLVPNHKNFDRSDNHVDNLEWTTYAENNNWNLINGHCKCGEDSPDAKIDNITVNNICRLMEWNYTNKEIVKILELDNSNYISSLLTRIRTGKQWKYISTKYGITVKNLLRQNNNEFVEEICKLLEKGVPLKEMRMILDIPDTEKTSFKNLVTGIRSRRSYKDISKKYKW